MVIRYGLAQPVRGALKGQGWVSDEARALGRVREPWQPLPGCWVVAQLPLWPAVQGPGGVQELWGLPGVWEPYGAVWGILVLAAWGWPK